MKIQAIIFDLDGTLIDSEPLGLEVAKQVLLEGGFILNEEELQQFIGIPDRDFYRSLSVKYPELDAEALLNQHTYLYEASLDTIPLIPGAVEVVKRCQQIAPLALVSGSTRAQIRKKLNRLGLAEQFAVIVSAEDVPIGKPDPYGYRLACRKLGVQEIGCVVIEDSIAGLKAARAAGMWTIALCQDSEESQQNADLLVSSLHDLTADRIKQLLSYKRNEHANLNLFDGWEIVAEELGHFLKRAGYLSGIDHTDPWALLSYNGSDLLRKLFCHGCIIPIRDVSEFIGTVLIKNLERMGVLARCDEGMFSLYSIVGALDHLLLIDRPVSHQQDIWYSSHTYLDRSSIEYISAVRKARREKKRPSVLEIGPGSGLACLLLARDGATDVWGLDIDFSSVILSRFNAALNNLHKRITIEHSDMFSVLNNSKRTFDVIIFHPPYRIIPPEVSYPNPTQRIGVSEDGLGLIRRFINEVKPYISYDGEALLYVQIPQYVNKDACLEFDDLAKKNLLKLRMSIMGSPLTVADIALNIATKFAPDEVTGVEESIRRYYLSLGITAFLPALFTLYHREDPEMRSREGRPVEPG